MAIKKYANGSWTPASRKYGTETDTITTLPVTIIGDGTPITSYTIKGNMEQNGTPTPSNPIYPSECGGRTENLFDKNTASTGGYISASGITPSANGVRSVYIPVKPGTSYYISNSVSISTFYAGVYYDVNKEPISDILISAPSSTITTPSNAAYICINTVVASLDNCMFTEGSTAPTSYIPYGYKLPITLGSTTTDIYLGEVLSTRRIKKLVLTGEEDWVNASVPIGNTNLYQLSVADLINVGNVAALDVVCTHFECGNYYGASTEGVQHSFFRLIFRSAETTLENWKTFLAQQYTNGTPVTVWYVLVGPETAVVNEPIRKIGDYVDSVSGTGLATSGAGQAFDINTTLKPSEVDMTYHGWHEHADTKFTT